MALEVKNSILSVARLTIGTGQIGRDTALKPEEEPHFIKLLRDYNQLPNYNGNEDSKFVTGMCMDERNYVSLADGQTDPNFFLQMVTYEIPGGPALLLAKAWVAANIEKIKGMNSFWDIYVKADEFLRSVGILEAGHVDCGAEKNVQKSIEESLPSATVSDNISSLMEVNRETTQMLEEMKLNKLAAAEKRIFDSFTSTKRQEYLKEKHLSRLAMLDQGAPEDSLHGHNGAGVLIKKHGGHAKNRINHETGKTFFGISDYLISRMAKESGSSSAEILRIYLAMYDDIVNVGNILFYPGMPVLTDMSPFKQEAA
jgi:hypothetical protein